MLIQEIFWDKFFVSKDHEIAISYFRYRTIANHLLSHRGYTSLPYILYLFFLVESAPHFRKKPYPHLVYVWTRYPLFDSMLMCFT